MLGGGNGYCLAKGGKPLTMLAVFSFVIRSLFSRSHIAPARVLQSRVVNCRAWNENCLPEPPGTMNTTIKLRVGGFVLVMGLLATLIVWAVLASSHRLEQSRAKARALTSE